MPDGAPPGRIRELAKTYRFLNDPNAPPWSVRFVGAVFLVAVLAAGFGALVYFAHDEPRANAMMSTTQANPEGTRTDYVGYAPASFDPAHGFDASAVQAQLDAWRQEHPDATIVSQTPVVAHGVVVGYDIAYR